MYFTNNSNVSSRKRHSCIQDDLFKKNMAKAQQEKRKFVENLVDVSAVVIESLWTDSVCSTQILGLKSYIRETLKRSKTTFSTLLTALIYILRVKDHLPRAYADICNFQPDNDPPHPSIEPALLIGTQALILVKCGRRMFLAALILATKFLLDQSYSIRSWAKITGLQIAEVSACETTLLRLLDYELFVPAAVFSRWSNLLFGQERPNFVPSSTQICEPDIVKSSTQKPLIKPEPTIFPHLHDALPQ